MPTEIMGKTAITAKLLFLAIGLSILGAGLAQAQNRPPENKAIVLAVFGTSHPEALPGILTIRDEVSAAFPGTPVRLAFTSNIIRRIWHSRLDDPAFRATHPDIPPEIFQVKAPLATIADLVDEDYGHIVVQPTHIAAGEEFSDLSSLVAALNSITSIKARNMPFRSISLGRPALGAPGIEYPYRQDLERAAETMAADVEKARRENRVLIYLAHGNRYFSTGVFQELEYVMRARYPEVPTYFTMAIGFPGLHVLEERLVADRVGRALLVPFMTVAGDHAKNDMAGEEPESLKSRLEARGIEVRAELTGLGERPEFAAIFVQNIRDAATAGGIELE